MRKAPRHLKQLENELLALGEEAMLLEELDGLVAGVLVCPEMIPPSEWLSVVWGQTADEAAPVFDTIDHLNKVLTLVMAHYNDVAKRLFQKPESYTHTSPSTIATATFCGSCGSRGSKRP